MSPARQMELMEADRPVQPPPQAPPRGLPPPPHVPRPALPAPQPLLALPPPPAAAQPGRGEGNHRRLTPDEMAKRCRLGLRFNCNEKYSRGHNRFCRHIFFVEGVEIDDGTAAAGEAETKADTPCFSLQAVVASPWWARCKSPWLWMLHPSSPSPTPAARTTSSPKRRRGLRAAPPPTAPSHRLGGQRRAGHLCRCHPRRPPSHRWRGVPGRPLLYIMPLAGCDVVLGTRWLGALGPIVWDLSSRRMSFQHQGQHVSWTGVDSPSVPALGAATGHSDGLPPRSTAAHVWRALRGPVGLPPNTCTTIASCSSPTHSQWSSAPTSTPPRTRTNWSSNVPP